MPYELPENIGAPLTSVCVPIPDDERHRRAFLGQLAALARYWTWEKDSTRSKARDTAAVWQGIYDIVVQRLNNGEECGVFPIPPIQIEGGTSLEIIEVNYPQGNTLQLSAAFETPAPCFGRIARDDTGEVSIAGQGSLTIPAGTYIYDLLINAYPVTAPDPYFRLDGVWEESQQSTYVRRARVGKSRQVHFQGSFTTASQTTLNVLWKGGSVLFTALIADTEDIISSCRLMRLSDVDPGEIEIPVPIFRLAGCTLQYSYDGEEWIDVSGWAESAPDCYKGEPGEPGTPGDDGEDGQPGDGSNQGTPPITEYEGDDLCKAATYLADKVIEIIGNVITDLQTLTIDEILESLFSGGGWFTSPLFQFIAFLETSSADWSTIQQDLIDYRGDLICALYNGELEQADAVTWALNFLGWTTATGQAVAKAIEAITGDKWALWAFIGAATVTGEDCSGCPQNWRATCDFTVSDCGFTFAHASRVNGRGIVGAPVTYSGIDQRVAIGYKVWTGVLYLDQVTIEIGEFTAGNWSGSSNLNAIDYLNEAVDPVATWAQLLAGGVGQYSKASGNQYTHEGLPMCFARCARYATNGNIVISRQIIEGHGVPPPEIVADATTFEYI